MLPNPRTTPTPASTAVADRRGHLCPSDNRDRSPGDNAATFLLTNIVPQAPRHNREVRKNLEEYKRQLATAGNEVYIIAGTNGTGVPVRMGRLRLWRAILTRAPVPTTLYKIIVVLPTGSDDVNRVSTNTRVIAVPSVYLTHSRRPTSPGGLT